MNNKKLNLNKIVITKLDNLHTIKGGVTSCRTKIRESCDTKPPESEYFTEEGTEFC